jgi:cysteine desulfurase
MTPIYLDYNATAPLLPAARDAWLAAQAEGWANPSSVHGFGQLARHRLDQAKGALARLLGCRAGELVVTSGGTEANALAIHAGTTAAPGGELLVSAIDHSSVLRNAQRSGASLRLLPVDGCGRLAPATVAAALGPATRMVCVQFANNELGTRQDIAGIVTTVRAAGPALVLMDACQGAGKSPFDLHALGVDFAAIAGHKFGAPKGVGLLYVRNGVRLEALLAGGRQQQGRRSGTEDAAAVCALAAALEHAVAHADSEGRRQAGLLEACWRRLLAVLPAVRWLAREAERLPNTMSLAYPGVVSEHLLARLDLAGIAVSAGSACMAGRGEPSHVIAALGLDPMLARSVIRVSIGPGTTAAELDAFADAYAREVSALAGS